MKKKAVRTRKTGLEIELGKRVRILEDRLEDRLGSSEIRQVQLRQTVDQKNVEINRLTATNREQAKALEMMQNDLKLLGMKLSEKNDQLEQLKAELSRKDFELSNKREMIKGFQDDVRVSTQYINNLREAQTRLRDVVNFILDKITAI